MKFAKIRKHKFLLYIILIGIIYFLRIIYLDQDLPPWGIGYYQPVDEGAYSLLALNYTHYGNINPMEIPGTEYITTTPLQARNNIFGNLLSLAGLELLGNNYYGFRFGYVLLGFANLILYVLILRKLKNNNDNIEYRYRNKLFGVFGLLLLFDFMFFLSSRIVENSSVRLFFNLLITYVWLQKKENYRSRFLLVSFLSVISVFLVYITNIFSVLAIFLCIVNIYFFKDRKKGLCAMWYSIIGGLLALIISELYYCVVWDSNLIEAFFGVIGLFAESNGYTITSISENVIKVVLKKFLAYWGSNSLLYNIPIVFVLFALFPLIVKNFIIKVDENITIILYFIFSFMLQTLFVEDCIGRKIIAIYPVFLILTYYILISGNIFLNDFMIQKKVIRCFYSIYLFLAFILCALVVYYRLYRAADRTNLDIDTLTRWTILMACGVIGLIFLTLLLNIFIVKIKNFIKPLIYITVIGLVAINSSLIYRFCIKEVTFFERDAMKELDKYISKEDVFVVGSGYHLGYSLYNEMKYIVIESLEEIQPLMEEDENILLIDYEWDNSGMDYYFNSLVFTNTSSTIEPVAIIHRNFMTFGEKRNFCLYKIKYLKSAK